MRIKSERGGLQALRKAKAQELVNAANNSTNPLLCSLSLSNMAPAPPAHVSLELQCLRASLLESSVQEELFSLLKSNMQHFYETSSWKWDEDKKWAEVFSPKAWLILCKCVDKITDCGACESAGFVSFRFEREGSHPVLYCYDIQLQVHFRGLSVGRYLIDVLTCIAAHFKMHRILLTVFKSNTRALNFFRKNGFDTDQTDPSQFEGNPIVDYRILSRKL
ncbi:hypothetical protein P879_07802 [Paragonimus westermani]|uniref:N-alpha-acetyltransferase 40 n=1 Tax=Paragonimus westermani TaxID=34504 RepID=A0A8T0DM08_9TREM|nr:hypothetical protein P879_07802 [Paragonimus westermani]